MSFEKTMKKVFVEAMEGKRPRGRPRLRWMDNLNNLMIAIPILYANSLSALF